MKKRIISAALAVSALFLASAANALPTTLQFSNVAADGSFSGTFSDTGISAGTFTDTYSFTFPATGLAGATISSIFTSQSNNVDLTSVTLDGTAFNIGSTGQVEFRYLSNFPVVSGLQTLIVSGISGGNASYAGTLAFTPAVPEPATWAMMLIGFAMTGFAMRRRRAVRARFAFA